MDKAERIGHFLVKKIRKANRAYQMISDGDRIAIGISGGKDSQTLLRLLHQWRSSAPFRFDLVAIHISSQGILETGEQHDEKLVNLFQKMDIPYSIKPLILSSTEGEQPSCHRCSWNRRKELFLTAKELGCNKLALGHHANDIAETALLNLLYHGRLESMAPRIEMFDGEITIIRPLALIEEKDLVYYARAAGFMGQSSCCPYSNQSKRAEMKKFLREIKKTVPKAQINLFRAVEKASGWRDVGQDEQNR